MAAKPSSSLSTAGPAAQDARRVIAEIAPYLRIAHQVRGRVRLKLADEALRAPALRNGAGERLRQLLGELPGVRGISLNALARSCVVEYDHAVIPDAAWSDLLGGRSTAAAATLLNLLAGVARALPVSTAASAMRGESVSPPPNPPPTPGGGKP